MTTHKSSHKTTHALSDGAKAKAGESAREAHKENEEAAAAKSNKYVNPEHERDANAAGVGTGVPAHLTHEMAKERAADARHEAKDRAAGQKQAEDDHDAGHKGHAKAKPAKAIARDYPEEFPAEEVRRLAKFVREGFAGDWEVPAHDLHQLSGYLLYLRFGQADLPPQPMAFASVPETNRAAADVLDNAAVAFGAKGAPAGAARAGFDWTALVPVVSWLWQKVMERWGGEQR